MRALIAGALLTVLLVPSVARADIPDAAKLKAVGVKVSWPVAATATLPANQPVRVEVTSTGRRVQLSLVTLDRTGTAVHAVARKTLRTGVFRARLGGPATYALRMRVAGQSYASIITANCTGGSLTGTTVAISLDALTVTAGGSLPYHLINTSRGCEMAGDGYALWQQQPDGSLTQVSLPWLFPSIGNPLAPGAWLAKSAEIPAGLAPGAYELRDSITGAGNAHVWASAPFTIV